MFVGIKFIGPPGSGKTTALKVCLEALLKAGHAVNIPVDDAHALSVVVTKVPHK